MSHEAEDAGVGHGGLGLGLRVLGWNVGGERQPVGASRHADALHSSLSLAHRHQPPGEQRGCEYFYS